MTTELIKKGDKVIVKEGLFFEKFRRGKIVVKNVVGIATSNNLYDNTYYVDITFENRVVAIKVNAENIRRLNSFGEVVYGD